MNGASVAGLSAGRRNRGRGYAPCTTTANARPARPSDRRHGLVLGAPGESVVDINVQGGECGFDAEVGERVFFYADRQNDGAFWASLGVTVRVRGRGFDATMATDDDGHYAMRLPGTGRYDVEVVAPRGMADRDPTPTSFEIANPQECLRADFQLLTNGRIWTVRGIYADQVGWFDGNPTKLFPLPEKERATRLVATIGGIEREIERGRLALAAEDFTWAAELADYVLVNAPAHANARRLRARALTALGKRQINAIARNYYLSSAQFLLKGLPRQ